MKFLDSKLAKANGALIGIFVLIGALFYFGGGMGAVTQSGTPTGSGGAATPAANTVTIVGAPCTQGTTLTASVVRRYTEVAQTTQNITILQNGVLRSTTAHGSTITVQSGSNGDTLDLYAGLASTTFYPRHLKGKIETCTSSATTGDTVFKEVVDATVGGERISYAAETGLFAAAPNKLVQIETAPTITIVNDGQANAQTDLNEVSGANLTIGSGGSGSVTVKFSPSANVGWGVVGGNVLACQYPSAIYDPTNPMRVTVVGGGVLEEASVKPSSITYPLIQANNSVKSFKFPALDARKNGDVSFTVKLTADPNRDPSGRVDRVNCTTADVSYYQKQNTGEYVLDIENRDTNVDLGGATTVFDFVIGVV